MKNAVEKRKGFLLEILTREYKPKIEKIIDHMNEVKLRGEEISTIENVIENDIHYEFNGILTRLDQKEGKKISVLQKEISFLQRDINNIQDLIDSFVGLIKNNEYLDFLLICKELVNQIESLTTKAFKSLFKFNFCAKRKF